MTKVGDWFISWENMWQMRLIIIGDIVDDVDVSNTSVTEKFHLEAVAVRAGLKTNVWYDWVMSSCACDCLIHQASSSTHPQDSWDSCYMLLLSLFQAPTPHHTTSDLLTRSRGAASRFQSATCLNIAGVNMMQIMAAHDPNHVSGGIIRMKQDEQVMQNMSNYVGLPEELNETAISIHELYTNYNHGNLFLRVDCNPSALIHVLLLSSCPSFLTLATKQFLGSKISNSRPICWLKELSSVHNTRSFSDGKKGNEYGNTFKPMLWVRIFKKAVKHDVEILHWSIYDFKMEVGWSSMK